MAVEFDIDANMRNVTALIAFVARSRYIDVT